jgi:hypothetical protein
MTNKQYADFCRSVLFLTILTLTSAITIFLIASLFIYLPEDFGIKIRIPFWLYLLFGFASIAVAIGVGYNVAEKIMDKIKIVAKDEKDKR